MLVLEDDVLRPDDLQDNVHVHSETLFNRYHFKRPSRHSDHVK